LALLQKRKRREIWESIVELIQQTFINGEIPILFRYGIHVLIPKQENQGFRGIALLETICKLLNMITHIQLTTIINLQNHGTGMATMHVKQLMQKAMRKSNPLYMNFLDIKKVYGTLDRERTLEFLQKYGVGPNMRQIIQKI
jgi:Reverse transcriptase (RNA-dependent DNA polymerase)